MVDAQAVAVVDGVEDLEEDAANEVVVAEVLLTLCDHAKEVAFLAEGQDHVDDGVLLDDVVQRDDVGMMRCQRVQRDLPALEGPLSLVESQLVQAFNRIQRLMAQFWVCRGRGTLCRGSEDVPGEVDDAVGAQA